MNIWITAQLKENPNPVPSLAYVPSLPFGLDGPGGIGGTLGTHPDPREITGTRRHPV